MRFDSSNAMARRFTSSVSSTPQLLEAGKALGLSWLPWAGQKAGVAAVPTGDGLLPKADADATSVTEALNPDADVKSGCAAHVLRVLKVGVTVGDLCLELHSGISFGGLSNNDFLPELSHDGLL